MYINGTEDTEKYWKIANIRNDPFTLRTNWMSIHTTHYPLSSLSVVCFYFGMRCTLRLTISIRCKLTVDTVTLNHCFFFVCFDLYMKRVLCLSHSFISNAMTVYALKPTHLFWAALLTASEVNWLLNIVEWHLNIELSKKKIVHRRIDLRKT